MLFRTSKMTNDVSLTRLQEVVPFHQRTRSRAFHCTRSRAFYRRARGRAFHQRSRHRARGRADKMTSRATNTMSATSMTVPSIPKRLKRDKGVDLNPKDPSDPGRTTTSLVTRMVISCSIALCHLTQPFSDSRMLARMPK